METPQNREHKRTILGGKTPTEITETRSGDANGPSSSEKNITKVIEARTRGHKRTLTGRKTPAEMT